MIIRKAKIISKQKKKFGATIVENRKNASKRMSNLLYKAVKRSNLREAKRWLKNGANPNFKVKGKPLLYYAIVNRDEEMVKLLIENGANPKENIIKVHKGSLKREVKDMVENSGVETQYEGLVLKGPVITSLGIGLLIGGLSMLNGHNIVMGIVSTFTISVVLYMPVTLLFSYYVRNKVNRKYFKHIKSSLLSGELSNLNEYERIALNKVITTRKPLIQIAHEKGNEKIAEIIENAIKEMKGLSN